MAGNVGRFFGSVIGGTILLVSTTAFFAVSRIPAKEIVRDWNSYEWVATQGVVKKRGWYTSKNHKGAVSHMVTVRYEYAVGAQNFPGSLSYEESLPFLAPKNERGEEFAPGDVIKVYYDPSTPQHTRHTIGLEFGSILLLLLGSGFGSLFSYLGVLAAADLVRPTAKQAGQKDPLLENGGLIIATVWVVSCLILLGAAAR